jgi:hypothetical protein
VEKVNGLSLQIVDIIEAGVLVQGRRLKGIVPRGMTPEEVFGGKVRRVNDAIEDRIPK